MNHEILRPAVEEACEKLAKHGIEGCSDKEVILACMGTLMFNGFGDIKKTINRLAWKIVAVCISTLIAIIIAIALI